MYVDVIETIDIDEKLRLRVYYDYDPGFPLGEAGDDYILLTRRHHGWDCRSNVPGKTIRDFDPILEYADNIGMALTKHLTRKGYRVVSHEWRGYSQGEYLYYVLGIDLDDSANDKYLLEEAKRYEAWLSGDAYVVTLERAHVWRDDDGQTMITWDTIDALGGCYLTRDYTAQDVARDMGWV